jgi:hypothetical protein
MLCAEPRRGLEKIIPLLSNLLGFHIILTRPFNQGHNLLLSLDGVLIGIRLPDSEIGHLLDNKSELGCPLTSGGKFCGPLPTQPCLHGKMILEVPLTMDEQGLLVAMLHEGLQRRHGLEAHEGQTKHGSMNRSYLIDWSDDVTQQVHRSR